MRSTSHIHCFSEVLCYICVFRTSRYFRRSLRSNYFILSENSTLCVERVFVDTASGALSCSIRYDIVVVSWYCVIKGQKGEALLVWVNFRFDLRVRDYKFRCWICFMPLLDFKRHCIASCVHDYNFVYAARRTNQRINRRPQSFPYHLWDHYTRLRDFWKPRVSDVQVRRQ